MFFIRRTVFSCLRHQVPAMAEFNPRDVNILENQVFDGEKMIADLKREIGEVMSMMSEMEQFSRKSALELENRALQNEIKHVKKELINVQVANGIQQIPVPDNDTEVSEYAVQTSVEEPSVSSNVASAESVSGSKPAKVPKPKKETASTADEPPIDVSRLDIRVGRVLHAQVHPDATQLYIEQIDVGEEISRTVVSGLVNHISLSKLDERMVVVLCNLKPQKMRGIVSEAMVLCASTPETVELLIPPPNAVAGDNITVPGYPRNPDLPFMNPKKKIFDKIADDLKVNSKKQASYKDIPWQIEGKEGFITVEALSGCHIR